MRVAKSRHLRAGQLVERSGAAGGGGCDCSVSYVQELGESNIWWTRAVTVNLPESMSKCVRFENVRVRSANGALWVVVDSRHAGTGGECLVQTWDLAWDYRGTHVQPARGACAARPSGATRRCCRPIDPEAADTQASVCIGRSCLEASASS